MYDQYSHRKWEKETKRNLVFTSYKFSSLEIYLSHSLYPNNACYDDQEKGKRKQKFNYT